MRNIKCCDTLNFDRVLVSKKNFLLNRFIKALIDKDENYIKYAIKKGNVFYIEHTKQ